jgi:DNA-binding transcriptional MocR family regulator
MKAIACFSCSKSFVPRPMGHNARYCSDKCKRRSQRARLRDANPNQLTQARARSYQRTKGHADRYVKHLAAARSSRRLVREWLAAYKLTLGCVDCGYREHAAALQLDHEGPKSVEIADARSSIKRLQAEIKAGSCKVRCANCHAVRTWQRKQVRDAGSVGAGCEG